MNYSEAVDFLKWLTLSENKSEKKQGNESPLKQESPQKEEEEPASPKKE